MGLISVESLLQKIQPVVQKTAEAIADVIGLEVEVADCQFIRIAGTGEYNKDCGKIMEGSFVYKHVVETGQMITIEHPGEHELCQSCRYCQKCPECAEMAMPIVWKHTVIGVIGLVSFNDQQTQHFMESKEWMIQFIGKMAELIAGNAVKFMENEPGKATSMQEDFFNLAELERSTIKKVLEEFGDEVGRAGKAAKILGISRATLYRKIQEYNL